jgi:hypothetical protein
MALDTYIVPIPLCWAVGRYIIERILVGHVLALGEISMVLGCCARMSESRWHIWRQGDIVSVPEEHLSEERVPVDGGV